MRGGWQWDLFWHGRGMKWKRLDCMANYFDVEGDNLRLTVVFPAADGSYMNCTQI